MLYQIKVKVLALYVDYPGATPVIENEYNVSDAEPRMTFPTRHEIESSINDEYLESAMERERKR